MSQDEFKRFRFDADDIGGDLEDELGNKKETETEKEATVLDSAETETPHSETESTVPTAATRQVAPRLGKKKRRGKRIALLFVGVVVIAGCGIAAYAYQSATTNITDLEGGEKTSVLGQIARIVDEEVEPLNGEEEDRINILLLGKGGDDHPGGGLADTLMVASIQPSTNKVSLFSLPRDLVVPHLPEGRDPRYPDYRKINNILFLGNGEMDYALETMQTVTGLEMHYYVIVDFAGFRNIIDTLGGLDVDVPNGFTDSSYPDYNYGYQTISFTEGLSHFDGETALQYARSRKGNNGEGGDIARAKRQQIIMEAVRAKALSASTLLNPVKLNGLLEDLGAHLSTNMEIWEMARFGKMAQEINQDEIINLVVDGSADGLVYADRGEGGAFVFIPNAGLGDFSEIQALAIGAFDEQVATVTAEETPSGTLPSEAAIEEEAIIAIQNGTTITGLAGVTANTLESIGLTVEGISNAAARNRSTTMIYDLVAGADSETQSLLESEFGVEAVTATIPATDATVRLGSDLDPNVVNMSDLPDDVHFIIVLGADQSGATADTTVSTGQNAQNTLE